MKYNAYLMVVGRGFIFRSQGRFRGQLLLVCGLYYNDNQCSIDRRTSCFCAGGRVASKWNEQES